MVLILPNGRGAWIDEPLCSYTFSELIDIRSGGFRRFRAVKSIAFRRSTENDRENLER